MDNEFYKELLYLVIYGWFIFLGFKMGLLTESREDKARYSKVLREADDYMNRYRCENNQKNHYMQRSDNAYRKVEELTKANEELIKENRQLRKKVSGGEYD